MQNTGKVALITGASSGIGKALASEFAREGYELVLTARRLGSLSEIASQLTTEFGIAVSVYAIDLQAMDGASRLYEVVKDAGLTIDVLVNNAGFGNFGEFKDTSLDTELAMMQLNMSSLVSLTKLFMPDLLANKGKILNVASTAAFQPGPYMAVYYATKSFVLSFSEAIAAELASEDVTVSALCPGPTASGFQDKADMHASALVNGKKLPTAADVAAKGFRALMRGQRVYIHGCVNFLMAQSVRFTPRVVVTSLVRYLSKPVTKRG